VTITQMIANTSYYGEHKRCGRVWPVPAIIERALFEEAQAQATAAKTRWVGRPSGDRLLTGGRALCAQCGHRLITQYADGKARYRCGNVQRYPQKRVCPASGIGAMPLENGVFDFVWGILTDARLLLRSAEAYYALQAKPSENELREKEAEVRRLQQHIQRVQEMVENSMMDVAAGKQKIQADERRIAEVSQELRAAGRITFLPPFAQAQAALNRFQRKTPTHNPERRGVLDELVDLRITWDGAGGLEIQGFVPLMAVAAALQNGTSCQADKYTSASLIPFYGVVAVATGNRAA
jgi:hypothetical protein